MEKNLKQNKGITLVALIITIVVMLILVAVSVNVVVKSNLIGTAEKTVDKYNKVAEEEGNSGVIEIDGKKYNSIDDYINLSSINIPGGTRVTEPIEYKVGDKTAIIPAKFTVSGIDSERTIEGGLVIYLIPEKELKNVKWDGTEKTKYDQFVWVPVTDANKMFMCQAKTADSECNLKIEGNEVICQTHKTADATKSKKMAGRLYATSTGNNFNSSLTTQTYNANSGLREPATINADSTNNIELTKLQEEYNNAVKKVIESKGFWIGRYETSGMSRSNDEIVVNIVAGKGTSDGINCVGWYDMYKQQQNYGNKKILDTTKIQSTMIFGAAYDQAMIFANCATKTTPTKSYSEVVTGNVEGDCYKNIYDLCGNLYERTTEADNAYDRVYRGRNLSRQWFC